MREIKACIAVCLAVATLNIAAFGAAARIEGTVTSAGKAIGNAFVLVHDYTQSSPNISQNYEVRTAADGTFLLTVAPGCYDIFVSAATLKPHSQRICLNDGQTKRIRIRPGTQTDVRLPVGQ